MITKTLSPELEYRQPHDLQTVYFNEGSLRETSIDVAHINDEIRTLVDNMQYIMEAYGGLGIAAPQVGENIRLFMINDPYTIFINPRMIRKWGKVTIEPEGCLSIPGYKVDVPRSRYASITWYDMDGQYHEGVFVGKEARIVQHEYDHLDGLLIDRFEK